MVQDYDWEPGKDHDLDSPAIGLSHNGGLSRFPSTASGQKQSVREVNFLPAASLSTILLYMDC